MPYFKSKNSCKIYFECHDINNERPVVVFLNGTTQTTRTWGLQVRQLKKVSEFCCMMRVARGKVNWAGQV